MKWKIVQSKYWWVLAVAGLVLFNYVSSFVHIRADLTAENRFTLSKPTRQLLQNLEDQVSITVLLDGDMPAGFKKLRNSTREMLDAFRELGKSNIVFRFAKPGEAAADSGSHALTMDSVMKLGLKPTNVRVQAKAGEAEEQRYLFPGALVSSGGRTVAVDFLQGQDMTGGIYALNNAEALLEYKLASAIQKVSSKRTPVIGYVTGNGEPLTYNVYDFIERTLKPNYGFSFLPLDSDSLPFIPDVFDALVVVKPTIPFTDEQKLKLDQYIMHGGKVIWLIDRLYAEMDSLMRSQSDFVAFDRNLNLDDILFRYGARINPDLVQDLQCDKIPLVVGNYGDKPQTQLTDWYYFPLLSSYSDNPIARNLDNVLSIFPNSIDTVMAPGIKKTILLASSDNARTLSTPAIVSLNSVKTEADLKTFNRRHIPIAVLLEGRFQSLYANRISQAKIDSLKDIYHQPFLPKAAADNKMIVVSDADLVTNVVTQKDGPLEMGTNQFTQYQYANKDFILNSIEYLVNPSGILETRSKQFTLRLLDPLKVEAERTQWQLINIAVPIVLVLLGGIVFQTIRRKKYSRSAGRP